MSKERKYSHVLSRTLFDEQAGTRGRDKLPEAPRHRQPTRPLSVRTLTLWADHLLQPMGAPTLRKRALFLGRHVDSIF